MIIIQWLDLLLYNAGEDAGIGGIYSKIAIGHGLLKRLVQDSVDVFDRLGREGSGFINGCTILFDNMAFTVSLGNPSPSFSRVL